MNSIRKYVLQQYSSILNEEKAIILEEETYIYAKERYNGFIEEPNVEDQKDENDQDDQADEDNQEDEDDQNDEEIKENKDFINIYKQVYMKVICSIKLNKNKDQVIKKIDTNEIEIKDLPRLHREILYPEKWSSINKIRSDALKKKRIKGSHKCPRCRSEYTVYQEVQTRSADEGFTIKVDCLDCSYHFNG